MRERVVMQKWYVVCGKNAVIVCDSYSRAGFCAGRYFGKEYYIKGFELWQDAEGFALENLLVIAPRCELPQQLTVNKIVTVRSLPYKLQEPIIYE